MADFYSYLGRGGIRMRLTVEQLSQDIETNTSRVRFRLGFMNAKQIYLYEAATAYIEFSGRRLTWSGRLDIHAHDQTTWVMDETNSVTHEADGAKILPIKAGISADYNENPWRLSTGNVSFTLTTIPRASAVTVSSGLIGGVLPVVISRHSERFTHTLRYSWGARSGTIAAGVGTSYSWTIPNEFANDIPTATSGIGTLYVDTYLGTTLVGTQQASFTATVPLHMKPSFTGVTLTDTNGVARELLSGHHFLQIISDIAVTFNGAVGSYGSQITGYRAELVNRQQAVTSNGGRLGMMNFTGSAIIRASVVDSRGRQSDTRDITITVLEYFAPTLSFTALRTRELPNIIQIVRQARIAPIRQNGRQRNVMTLSFKVAPFGTTDFKLDNGSATGTYTTVSELVNATANMSGNYPANKTFTVIGTLSDKFTSTEFSAVVATEKVVMSYDKFGRVGIGKTVEHGKDGSLDVEGDIYAGGRLIQLHALTSGNPVMGYGKSGVDASVTYDSGFYWTALGVPGGDWGVLEVYRFSDKEVQQIFRQRNGSRSWSRYRNNQTGIWTAWVVVGLDQFYPIGSIYQSVNSSSPATTMGGTWQRLGNTHVLYGTTIYVWRRTA